MQSLKRFGVVMFSTVLPGLAMASLALICMGLGEWTGAYGTFTGMLFWALARDGECKQEAFVESCLEIMEQQGDLLNEQSGLLDAQGKGLSDLEAILTKEAS